MVAVKFTLDEAGKLVIITESTPTKKKTKLGWIQQFSLIPGVSTKMLALNINFCSLYSAHCTSMVVLKQ